MIMIPQHVSLGLLNGPVLSVLSSKDSIVVVHAGLTVVKYTVSLVPDGSGLPFTAVQDSAVRIPSCRDFVIANVLSTLSDIEESKITVESPPTISNSGRISLFKTVNLRSEKRAANSSRKECGKGYGKDRTFSALRKECEQLKHDCKQSHFGLRSGNGWNWLISSGYWNGTVMVHDIETGTEIGRSDSRSLVTCVACGGDGIVIMGGLQGSLAVWTIGNAALAYALDDVIEGKSHHLGNPSMHFAHRLMGHVADITAIALSTSLDIAFSCAADARVTVHRVTKGRFVRTIFLPGSPPPVASEAVLDPNGNCIISCAEERSIHVVTLNGVHMARVEWEVTIRCMVASFDGEYVVCGGSDGSIELFSLPGLGRKHVFYGQAGVTSLEFGPRDSYLVVGFEDGKVSVCVDIQQRLAMVYNGLEEMYI